MCEDRQMIHVDITPGAALPSLRGRVEAIAVAEEATAPMRQVERARALAGRGLDGDRYAEIGRASCRERV